MSAQANAGPPARLCRHVSVSKCETYLAPYSAAQFLKQYDFYKSAHGSTNGSFSGSELYCDYTPQAWSFRCGAVELAASSSHCKVEALISRSKLKTWYFNSLSESEGCAARLGAPQRPLSADTRATLLADALRDAATLGDRHPLEVDAVATTHQLALQATCHCDGGGVIPANTPVYLVVVRGRFSCNCSVPPHGPAPPDLSVLTLQAPATEPLPAFPPTGEQNTIPNLEGAGAPVLLYEAPRSG